jgi:hypothetical protein
MELILGVSWKARTVTSEAIGGKTQAAGEPSTLH